MEELGDCNFTLEDYYQNYLLISSDIPLHENHMSIYPIPFNNNLSIKCDECNTSNLTIINTNGAVVLETNFYKNLSLDTNSWAKGIYILKVLNKDQSITVKRIIKQ